jgi:hypothetical protein
MVTTHSLHYPSQLLPNADLRTATHYLSDLVNVIANLEAAVKEWPSMDKHRDETLLFSESDETSLETSHRVSKLTIQMTLLNVKSHAHVVRQQLLERLKEDSDPGDVD